jgi:hypothetical protein
VRLGPPFAAGVVLGPIGLCGIGRWRRISVNVLKVSPAADK